MNARFILLAVFYLSYLDSSGQDNTSDSMISPLYWRNIGPANQGGRVVDMESLDKDYRKVWLATGSGGVWYSENAGNTWTPIFDKYETASIGDIAVFQPDPKIIWVGTGEANNRNSVSWGNGVYKSTDGGKTFTNVGLKNTHHIGRIILHPTNPEIAYVAAVGHLWGNNQERGLYMTKNGGKNWQLLTNGLPRSEKEGCTDLIIHPENPDILFAAFYYRIRTGYNFLSGSNEGGIFKSTDGGVSWKKLKNGLPQDSTGRIGLAISRSNPDIVMAIIEAKRTDTLAIPGTGIYRSEDGGENWKYVNTYNNRPFYYSQIRIHPQNPQKVFVLTTPLMISIDGGKKFSNGSPDEEIHGDYHALWLDPADDNRWYIGNDKGAFFTQDGGEKYFFLDNLPIAQYYRIAYDMQFPYRVYGGLQDNGFYAAESFSRDARGILNDVNWKVHWGDGQYAAVNPLNANEVYTSSENGSILKLNPVTHELINIMPTIFNTVDTKPLIKKKSDQPFFRFNWSAPFILSSHDNRTLYMGSQYVLKSSDKGKSWHIISPDLSSGDSSKIKTGLSGGLTPDNTGAENFGTVYALAESPLDINIIWAGTDDGRLHLTLNGGKSWNHINENWPAETKELWIDRIAASSYSKNRAYVTVDGHRNDVFRPIIMQTDDAGKSWSDITGNIPATEVIRSFIEDPVNENLLFAGTETGVWYSSDRGKEWKRFNINMPTVSVYDLKIHPREKDLIAATHGRSLWIMDDIGYLEEFTSSIKNKKTHLFDLKPVVLWQNTSRGGQRGHFLFAGENPQTIKNNSSLPRASTSQTTLITVYINNPVPEKVIISITDSSGKQKATIDTVLSKGVYRLEWDMVFKSTLLTGKEIDLIDSLLNSIPGVERSALTALRRVRQSKDVKYQREQVERIVELNPGIPIPEKYLPVKAKPGVYTVTLIAAGVNQQKKLIIKADPITQK